MSPCPNNNYIGFEILFTTFYQRNSSAENRSQQSLWIIHSKWDMVSGQRRFCWAFLNVVFQCWEHREQNSIRFHYIGLEAEISETEILNLLIKSE